MGLKTEQMLGQVIGGRYRIISPLATGGMGSVFVGKQTNLGRKVAIKSLHTLIKDPALQERFRNEAQSLAALYHPSIVEVYDFVEEEDGAYLVMAFVDGLDLRQFIDEQPGLKLSLQESLDLLAPIASALVEIHAASIVHRDIKPANIIRHLRADGKPGVKLVDFGIARHTESRDLTISGHVVGTPQYMAPEVLLAKPHSEASDVYALGIILYEMLCGEKPFEGAELHTVLLKCLNEPMVLPPEIEVMPVSRLLNDMLNKDPEMRPDAKEVYKEMERMGARSVKVSGPMAEGPTMEFSAEIPLGPGASGQRRLPATGPGKGPGTDPGTGPPSRISAPPAVATGIRRAASSLDDPGIKFHMPEEPKKTGRIILVIAVILVIGAGATLAILRPWEGKDESASSAGKKTAPAPAAPTRDKPSAARTGTTPDVAWARDIDVAPDGTGPVPSASDGDARPDPNARADGRDSARADGRDSARADGRDSARPDGRDPARPDGGADGRADGRAGTRPARIPWTRRIARSITNSRTAGALYAKAKRLERQGHAEHARRIYHGITQSRGATRRQKKYAAWRLVLLYRKKRRCRGSRTMYRVFRRYGGRWKKPKCP